LESKRVLIPSDQEYIYVSLLYIYLLGDGGWNFGVLRSDFKTKWCSFQELIMDTYNTIPINSIMDTYYSKLGWKGDEKVDH